MPQTPNKSAVDHTRRRGPLNASHLRWVALGVLLATTTAMVALLYGGISARGLRLVVFILVCVASAGIVALIPAGFRKRIGLPVSAFVTAAGLLPLLIAQENQRSSDKPPSVNVDYAAELLAKGPFTGDIPEPLQLTSMKAEPPDDTAAIAQVALEFAFRESDYREGANMYLILYPSKEHAAKAAERRRKQLASQYTEFGEPQGDSNGFLQFANGEIIGGGARDHIFCESSIFPDSNANVSLLSNLTSACLNYGKQMLRVASNN